MRTFPAAYASLWGRVSLLSGLTPRFWGRGILALAPLLPSPSCLLCSTTLSYSDMRYPTPRTVSIFSPLLPSFCLSVLTCTSTVLVSPSKSYPQMSSSRQSRVMTMFGFFIRRFKKFILFEASMSQLLHLQLLHVFSYSSQCHQEQWRPVDPVYLSVFFEGLL